MENGRASEGTELVLTSPPGPGQSEGGQSMLRRPRGEAGGRAQREKVYSSGRAREGPAHCALLSVGNLTGRTAARGEGNGTPPRARTREGGDLSRSLVPQLRDPAAFHHCLSPAARMWRDLKVGGFWGILGNQNGPGRSWEGGARE